MKITNIIFLVLIILGTLACDEVPFDPRIDNQNENLLVVDGIIGNDPDFRTIKLSRTAAYLDGKLYEAVTGASVTVSSPAQVFTFTEEHDGLYDAPVDWDPQVGTEYTLRIELDGTTYEASSVMREPVNMHSLRVVPNEYDKDTYDVKAWVKDNEEKGEHFLFKYVANGALHDFVDDWSVYSDELANNVWMQDATLFYDLDTWEGDIVEVLGFSISKNYYQFVNAAMKNTSEPMPFMPPAGIPIEGNISNGALGFFEVSSITRLSTTVEE